MGIRKREKNAQDVRLCPMFKSVRPVTFDMKVVLPDPVILGDKNHGSASPLGHINVRDMHDDIPHNRNK